MGTGGGRRQLPYYAATAILERLCGIGTAMRRGVFLIQKEVAERITASPGSREYGYLSVAMQLSADIELLFEVKPAAFHPPPKVDSAVLRFQPRDRASELGVPAGRIFSVSLVCVSAKSARPSAIT